MPLFRSMLATSRKEWLILRRDWAGLLTLLVMPAALIIIMALIQDAPFRDYQEVRVDLLFADEDSGPLANEIRTGLRQSKNFTLIDSVNGKSVDMALLQQALKKGTQHVAIVIPRGASGEVANSANMIANTIAGQLGTGRLPEREPRDSLAIRLYFDPIAKPAFRLAIHAALEKFVTAASSRLLVKRISKLAGTTGDSSNPRLERLAGGIGVRESILNEGRPAPQINSVQHNVPAWAIFGMFFIVVPLSGHIIKERNQGSSLRVRLIPGAETGAGMGRILFYTLVCCTQFVCMCAVGRWLLPHVGLPALTLGTHPTALIPIVLATAACATSYGYLVGTIINSGTQALSFGAISIVILSALGGIWVPVDIMPHTLQVAAKISPLYWSLSAMQDIILRQEGWRDILGSVAILFALALVLWGIALFKKHNAEAGG